MKSYSGFGKREGENAGYRFGTACHIFLLTSAPGQLIAKQTEVNGAEAIHGSLRYQGRIKKRENHL